MRIAPKAARSTRLNVVAFREDRNDYVQKRGKQAQVGMPRKHAIQLIHSFIVTPVAPVHNSPRLVVLGQQHNNDSFAAVAWSQPAAP